MSSDWDLGQKIVAWIVMTMILIMILLGAVAITNYRSLEGGTCGNIGGKWVETTYQFICVVDKEKRTDGY